MELERHIANRMPRATASFLRLLPKASALVLALAVLLFRASAMAQQADYDSDNNNLIDITTAEQLNAMRYDLDGDGMPGAGTQTYAEAFVNAVDGMGCASDCIGYELLNDLDFDDAADYASGTVNADWTSGAGWAPIGSLGKNFAAVFNGNGHAVRNLRISRAAHFQSLFGIVGEDALITNVGVTGSVNARGFWFAGGLVGGVDKSAIENSYSAVAVEGGAQSGSLLGYATDASAVRRSYATGAVYADSESGGLLGRDFDSQAHGTVEHTYATGYVDVTRGGGLIGVLGNVALRYGYATGLIHPGNQSSGGLGGSVEAGAVAAAVYWDSETSAKTNAFGEGALAGVSGKTAAELQAPTSYAGIYADWNATDADGNATDYWDFGNANQYPALKIDFDNDGTASWQEFGYQLREGPRLREGLQRVTRDRIAFDLRWSAPDTSHWDNPPQIDYRIYRDGAALDIGADDIAETRAANGEIVYSYADAGLLADTVYAYHIAAVVGGGEPSRSATAFEVDYDRDDDGLIEITTLEQLSAIRWDLDGDGKPDESAREYAQAFPGITDSAGCPDTCNGYELRRDLDFDDAASYASGSVNTAWTSGVGWLPIGTVFTESFAATFNGNGHAIYNLYVNSAERYRSLFGVVNGVISNIGVTGSVSSTGSFIGGLAGVLAGFGMIEKSYSAVSVEADASGGSLAGWVSASTVRLSYASGVVNASASAGGLLGHIFLTSAHRAEIEHVYATGFVNATGDDNSVGGLLGFPGQARLKYAYATALVAPSGGGLSGDDTDDFSATAAYWDIEASDRATATPSAAIDGVEGKATAKLQAPTAYAGIYADWDEGNAADYWDFGAANQYPALNIDFDNDGMASWQEFGYQLREGPAVATTDTSAGVLSWSAPDTSHWPRDPPSVGYAIYRNGAPLRLAADAIAKTADANGDVVYSYVDPDASADSAYRYHIAATVNGGEASRSGASDAPESLTIADSNDAANAIAENAAVGTAVTGIALSASDEAGNAVSAVTWSIASAPTGLFAIDADGVVRLAASDALDYESTPTHSITARAVAGAVVSNDLSLTISVLNVPKSLTIADSNDAANAIAENAAVGTAVTGIALSASDEAGNAVSAVTWSIASAPTNLFAIDADGVVRLAASDALDHESAPIHSVTARAMAGAVVSNDLSLTISVLNVPKSLTIADSNDAANAIAENAAVGTAVTGIALSASDEAGNAVSAVTWSIASAPTNLFAIDADGVVRLAASDALDYESAPTHSVTAQASTGSVSATIELAIAVTDVDETPPPQLVYTAIVAESATAGTAIAGVTLATQAVDGAVTWSLSDPNDPDLFAISADGVITLIASGALDYEDADARIHRVMVTAEADGEELVTMPLTIRVTNVLEALTIVDSDATTNAVAENAAIGTTVTGITLTVRDEGDRAVGGVTWSIASVPSDLFAIDSASGEVTLAGAPDYETSTAHAVIARATKDAVVSDDLRLTIAITKDPTDDDGTEPSEPALKLRLRLFLEGPLR